MPRTSDNYSNISNVDNEEDSNNNRGPLRHVSTDEPSQITEGSFGAGATRNTTTSSFSALQSIRHVVQEAAQILQGRLPSDNNHDRPWDDAIVQVVNRGQLYNDDDNDSFATAAGVEPNLLTTRGPRRNFVLEDRPHEMTLSRRLALKLIRYTWYNPSLKLEHQEHDGSSNHIANENNINHSESNYTESNYNDGKPKTNGEIPLSGRHRDAYPFTVSKREKPSLEKAWAYFEHTALPRYLIEKKENHSNQEKKNICLRAWRRLFCKGDQQLQRAEPGELYLPTALYRPIFTPHNQLGDWGLGIGLYFSTLRAITILTLFAGLLNIPNIMYFAGDEYSNNQDNGNRTALAPLTRGSAICTTTTFVPCLDCRTDQFPSYRIFGNATLLDTAQQQQSLRQVSFALKNNCDGATLQQGLYNYATLVLVCIGVCLFGIYLTHMEVKYDEDEQTAQDYSIVVENPPPDATDAEEWRRFFYDNFNEAHVTTITIAVDNDLLVRSLVERREILRKIEMMVDPGTSLDTLTLTGIAAQEERSRRFFGRLMATVSPGVPEFFARLVVLTSKVQGLSQQDYPASNVFVTFETEAAQRRVLEALSVGSLQVAYNNKTAVPNPQHLFRGEHVLSVAEPDEPNTVRWQDLNEKFKDRVKQQGLTTFCTVAAIVTIAFLVEFCNEQSPVWSAMAISVFNSVFPMFAKFLCSFEAHSSEGGKQRSLYFKIALFRWVNTAVVITMITPFTSTLATNDDEGLITKIYLLFFTEMFTTNAIQLADPVGHLQRHFLAPRAKTQDSMNLLMSGQEFELAERYTNMTKILFLAVWYCALYPGTLFLCSFTLLINYFTDRVSLMRTWKRPPQLGPKISQFSRRYFFTLAILAMAIMSSYYWSGFPFDNLCATGETVPPEWVGTWQYQKSVSVPSSGISFSSQPGVIDREMEVESFTVEPGTLIYKYCLQDFLRYEPGQRKFPFLSSYQKEGSEWMTDEQELIADIFGYTVIALMALIILSIFWSGWKIFLHLFRGEHSSRGEDQGINFSDVPSISTFIPQVSSPDYAYPLLACNIDNIDHDLLDWTDPDRPFSFYDLTKDAEVLLKGMDISGKVTFSTVVHYPPEK